MNYKLFSVLTFVAGASIGSLVTWKIVKDKYERIAQEEIDSVKEVFAKNKPALEDCTEEIIRPSDNKPSVIEYAAKIADLGYSGEAVKEEKSEYEEENNEGEEDDSMADDKPYVISQEDFDESDYDTDTLTLYADGVLTDSWYNEPISDSDIKDMVGKDAVENFDKYAEGDTVYVRNDAREIDYEIQRDLRKYSDVVGDVESTED